MLTLDKSVFLEYERLFDKWLVTKDDSEIQEWSKRFTKEQHNQILEWHRTRCNEYFE